MHHHAAHAVALTITVPEWLQQHIATLHTPFDSDEARMRLAISLSDLNVERGGSPFGAAVFAGSRLVAAGVNQVLEAGFSLAHAEIVALMHAQYQIAQAQASDDTEYTLFSSAEPCCQCFGALFWTPINRLVCGARRADVEQLGFDEGPKPQDWVGALNDYGITVEQGLLQREAADVLNKYAQHGGPIYGRNRRR